MSTETSLPQPDSLRWKPLRAGLTDLFYYDQQEFRFRDGRLLLRGNNGAGKSKVLALLMPFLLDGDLAPHRVEPDADSRKRMEWNLLLGGEHPHPERIGYTWMEFGRTDEDGTAQFCTIGCGLKAVTGRGIAAHWYFVSSARIGEQLRLLDDHGYPLSRDRLGEQLSGNGERYDTATAYRRAVDEALFGLGENRYGALVDLLIRLRQPQLSKKPSEKVLSQALTESLPPLDQAILADVAEAFRSLQEDRDELTEMTEALRGARDFLTQYRDYARVACRRRTTRLRQAHSRYEQVGRDLGSAKDALTSASEIEDRVRAEQTGAEDERVRLEAHQEGLSKGAAADAAKALENARKAAHDTEGIARDRNKDRDDAASRSADLEVRVRTSDDDLTSATTDFRAARHEAAEQAAHAAIGGAHESAIAAHLDTLVAAAAGSPEFTRLRRAAEHIATTQTSAIKHVRQVISAAAEANSKLTSARQRIDDLDSAAAKLAEAAAEAEQAITAEAARLTSTTSEYLRGATELVIDDLHGVLDELNAWALLLGGESPARIAVAARVAILGDDLTRRATEFEQAEAAVRASRADLTAERDRLLAGGIEYPPTPHTRDAERAGPALWQVVAFAEDVSDPDRAGVEAALEAAGVLDARISPDGQVRAEGNEVIVSGADTAPGRTLAEVLVPDIAPDDPATAGVRAETIESILTAIGFGADSTHHSWVERSGRFRLGVIDGQWHKPAAQYIGAQARERFRLERIAALETALTEADEQLEELAAQRDAVEGRRRTLRAEASGLPGEDALRTAHRHMDGILTRRHDVARDRIDAVSNAARAESAAAAAEAQRDRDAADAGLPVTASVLDDIADSLTEYRIAVGALWSAVEKLRNATFQHEQAASDAESARLWLADRAETAETARVAALSARAYFTTLNEAVGAEVAQLQADLEQVATDLDANKRRRGDLTKELERAIRDLGVAEGKLNELTGQLDIDRASRDEAIALVARFADTGLFQVALTDTEVPDFENWSAATAVAFARAVDTELADAAEDDKTLDRVQRRVAEGHKVLADLLAAQGNSAAMTPREEAITIEVVFRGRTVTITELTATLEGEVSDRSRLLTEREREVLENHLVDEVASALQELILAAETQEKRMNRELESRPTSTGMRLRLRWIPSDDAPTGAKAALRQLRQHAELWNESDRAAVGEFLQREIERVRSADGPGTWLEHLTTAFDYRRWNRFVIELQQRGQWRSATGPASGGERVLAASVPLFAAASAHYESASNPHAPRLVMLDEAFAGVDDNARAKYLGLLAAFDLDVVMTSERDWGCYPEVPGLAIAQLARSDDVPAVLVTSWEWDGARRVRMEYPDADAPAAAATGPAPDGLF